MSGCLRENGQSIQASTTAALPPQQHHQRLDRTPFAFRGSRHQILPRFGLLPVYAREHVSHVWLVDPLERMVEVYRLDGDGYRLVVTRGGNDAVRLEPFGAVELELRALWPTEVGNST